MPRCGEHYYDDVLKRSVADAQPSASMIVDFALYQYNRSIYDLSIYNTASSADVVSFSDYYPYGQQMAGRFGTDGGKYRYGFQGQEMDDEIKGDGNSLNYEYRMHDPRIGKFFAIDPLTQGYPYNSPYAFSENVVINAVELEGLELKYRYDVFLNADGKSIHHIEKVGTILDKNINYNMRIVNYYSYDEKYLRTVRKRTDEAPKPQTEMEKIVPTPVPTDRLGTIDQQIYTARNLGTQKEFDQEGGLYITGSGGDGSGPGVTGKHVDYFGNIDLLLAVFSAWNKGGSAAPIPKSGTPMQILKGVAKHQWDVGNKIYKTTATSIKKEGNPSYTSSDNDENSNNGDGGGTTKIPNVKGDTIWYKGGTGYEVDPNAEPANPSQNNKNRQEYYKKHEKP